MADADVQFRTARPEDLAAVIGLLADDELGVQREDTSLPVADVYLDAFRAIEADNNQRLVVVVDDNTVVGTLQLSFIPGISHKGAWRGQIESVRIAADRRSQGLGRQMFEWAISECRLKGCGMVQLTTDKSRQDARRFYEGLGFTASHEGFKLKL